MQVSKTEIHWYNRNVLKTPAMKREQQFSKTVNQHPYILKSIHLTYNPKKEYTY